MLLAMGVHYLAYQRFLGSSLADPDPLVRRAGLTGWARFAIAWQLLVLVIGASWILPFALNHVRGLAWTAPAIGLVLGTALPLQLVVIRISRAARG
jgi:hypothetical protein